MKEAMATMLRKLRLSGAAQTLDVRFQEARGNSLSHEEFLELILQDEMNIRKVSIAGHTAPAMCG